MPIKVLLTSFTLALVSQWAHAAVLYDVRFSSPPNVEGQSIVVDGTPNTPSKVNMGVIEMRSNVDGLPGNWAVFNAPNCSYDQMTFTLPAGLQKAYVSWEVSTNNLVNSDNHFSVHLDSTGYGARSVSMHGGGNRISLFNHSKYANFANLIDKKSYRFLARVDAASDLLEISIDGNSVHRGTFNNQDLTSVRMNLSPWTGAPKSDCSSTFAALTNVLIYEDPSDLTPPPPPYLQSSFSLLPDSPSVVPPQGGTLRYTRQIQNISPEPLSLSTWITVSLPDGTGYPLINPRLLNLAPGANYTVSRGGLRIPSWLPSGPYKARMAVVNTLNGERFYNEIMFDKLP
ncbi:RbmA family biofilm matrix protein [Atopomonas hussainii]|uniref:RbmA family biofilm matrix protein n=1 Tax=Atopomonas hussainii TaxID=1429083 RepID=UPI0008FFFE9B|nr:hypothetical protein [Atopomonas hussainii]